MTAAHGSPWDRDRLIEVAARGQYENDEKGMTKDHAVPWVDAAPFVRNNYRVDAAPVVDAILTHLTGRPPPCESMTA